MANAPAETEAASQTEQKGNSPVATFRHHGLAASVFENDGNSGGTYFNVSIQNRYLDKKSNEWKDSKSLLRDQLPVLEHLLRQAYAYILEQESTGQKAS